MSLSDIQTGTIRSADEKIKLYDVRAQEHVVLTEENIDEFLENLERHAHDEDPSEERFALAGMEERELYRHGHPCGTCGRVYSHCHPEREDVGFEHAIPLHTHYEVKMCPFEDCEDHFDEESTDLLEFRFAHWNFGFVGLRKACSDMELPFFDKDQPRIAWNLPDNSTIAQEIVNESLADRIKRSQPRAHMLEGASSSVGGFAADKILADERVKSILSQIESLVVNLDTLVKPKEGQQACTIQDVMNRFMSTAQQIKGNSSALNTVLSGFVGDVHSSAALVGAASSGVLDAAMSLTNFIEGKSLNLIIELPPLIVDFISLVHKFNWYTTVSFVWRTIALLVRNVIGNTGELLTNLQAAVMGWFRSDQNHVQGPNDVGSMSLVSLLVGTLGTVLLQKVPGKTLIREVTDSLRLISTAAPFLNRVSGSIGAVMEWMVGAIPEYTKAWMLKLVPTKILEYFRPTCTVGHWAARVFEMARHDNMQMMITNLEMRAEVAALHSQGVEILKSIVDGASSDFKPGTIQTVLTAMRLISELYRLRFETRPMVETKLGRRRTPYALWLYGDPGCGKTSVAPVIARALVTEKWDPDLKIMVPVDLNRLIYNRTTGQKYWTGYNGQAVVVIDDFAQANASGEQNDPLEYIQIVNPTTTNLSMAAVEDKYRSFNSECVIVTTNTPWPVGPEVRAWDAVYRRRNALIKVTVAEGYSLPDGRLDVTKIDPTNLDHYRFQLFDVTRQGRRVDSAPTQLTMAELLSWLARDMKRHNVNEFRAVTMTERLAERYGNIAKAALEAEDELERAQAQRVVDEGLRMEQDMIDIRAQRLQRVEVQAPRVRAQMSDTFDDAFDTFEVRAPTLQELRGMEPRRVMTQVMAGIFDPDDTETREHLEEYFQRSNYRMVFDAIKKWHFKTRDTGMVVMAPERIASARTAPGSSRDMEARIRQILRDFSLSGVLPSGAEEEHSVVRLLEQLGSKIGKPNTVREIMLPEDLRDHVDPRSGQINWPAVMRDWHDEPVPGTMLSRQEMETMTRFERSQADRMRITNVANAEIFRMNMEQHRKVKNIKIFEVIIASVVAVAGIAGAVIVALKVSNSVMEWYKPKEEENMEEQVVDLDRIAHAHVGYSGDQKTAKRMRPSARPGRQGWTVKVQGPPPSLSPEEMGYQTEDLIMLLSHNEALVTISFMDPEKQQMRSKTVHMYFLRGSVGMTVAHLFTGQELPKGTLISATIMGFDEPFTEVFDRRRLTKIPDYDLAMYTFGNNKIRPFRDITKHIQTELDAQHRTNFEMVLVRVRRSKDMTVISHTRSMGEQQTEKVDFHEGYFVDPLIHGYCYDMPTAAGDCGAAILHESKDTRRPIMGLHCGGSSIDMFGLAILLTQERVRAWLIDAEKKYPNVYFPMDDIPTVQSGKCEVIPDGQFTILGVPTERDLTSYQPGTTSIRPSLIFRTYADPVTQPAVLRANDPRILVPDAHPGRDGVAKYGVLTRGLFDPDILKMIRNQIMEELGQLPRLRPVRKLTEFEAINGLFMDEHVSGLAMSTSPGLPYVNHRPGGCNGKRWLFEGEEATSESTSTYVVKDEFLRRRIDERLEKAKRGERMFDSVWNDVLKDERRELGKIETANTRLFTMAPVDSTIVARMYFLTAIAHVESHPCKTFSAIGMNPMSMEWTRLVRRLLKISPYGFDADYKKWDGRVTPELWTLVLEVLHSLYTDATEEDFLVRSVIVNEHVHTIISFERVLYMKHVGNPSGGALTTIMNTIANAALLRYCYFVLVPIPMRTYAVYLENVCTITYGDDNVNAISQEVLKYFNLKTVASICARFDIGITDPSKTKEMQESRRVLDFTFLKNGIRVTPAGIFLPLMAMDTIMECPMWDRESDRSRKFEAAVVNVQNSQRWLSMYGRQAFNDFTMRMRLELTKVAAPGVNWYLYSMEDMLNEYEDILPAASVFPESEIAVEFNFKPFVSTATKSKLEAAMRRGAIAVHVKTDDAITGTTSPLAEAASTVTSPTHIVSTAPGEIASGGVTVTAKEPIVPEVRATSSVGASKALASYMRDQLWTVSNMAERLTLVTSATTWDTSQATGTKLLRLTTPWDLLTSNMNSAPFERFKYVRFDSIRFRLQVYGTREHAGGLIMAFVPCQIPDSIVEATYQSDMHMLTQLQHAIITGSAEQSIDMVVPWRYPDVWMPIGSRDNRFDFLGSLVVSVFSQLTTGAACTTINLDLFASFEGAEFSIPEEIPRNTMSFSTQQYGVVINAGTIAEKTVQRTNRPQKKTGFRYHNVRVQGASYSTTNTTVQVKGDMVGSGVDPAVRTGDEIDATAHVTAMHNAPHVGPSVPVLVRGMPKIANVDLQLMDMERLGYRTQSEEIVKVSTFDTNHDEMAFAPYIQMMTEKDRFVVNTSITRGTILASGAICPFESRASYIDASGTQRNGMPQAYGVLSNESLLDKMAPLTGARYWSGNYRMTFQVFKTPYTQFRWAVVVLPGAYEVPSNIVDMLNVYNATFDFNETTNQASVEIPYFGATRRMIVPNETPPTYSASNPTAYVDWFRSHCCGVWAVVALGPVVCSLGAVGSCEVVRFVGGAPNLRLFEFGAWNSSFAPVNIWQGEIAAVSDEEEEEIRQRDYQDVRAQAGEESDAAAGGSGGAEDTVPLTQPLAMATSPYKLISSAGHEMYEQDAIDLNGITSFREILRRWVLVNNTKVVSKAVPTFPLSYYICQLVTPPIGASSTSATMFGPGKWPAIAAGFSYWHGGMDWCSNIDVSANVYGPRMYSMYLPGVNKLYTTNKVDGNWLEGQMESEIWGNMVGQTVLSGYRTGTSAYAMSDPVCNRLIVQSPFETHHKTLLLRPVHKKYITGSGTAQYNMVFVNNLCVSGQQITAVTANQATNPTTGFVAGDLGLHQMIRMSDQGRLGGFIGFPHMLPIGVNGGAGTTLYGYIPDNYSWSGYGEPAGEIELRATEEEARQYDVQDSPVIPANFNTVGVSNASITGTVDINAISQSALTTMKNTFVDLPVDATVKGTANTYLTGYASSLDFPVTVQNESLPVDIPNPLPVSFSDVVKVTTQGEPPLNVAITSQYGPLPITSSGTLAVQVTNKVDTNLVEMGYEPVQPIYENDHHSFEIWNKDADTYGYFRINNDVSATPSMVHHVAKMETMKKEMLPTPEAMATVLEMQRKRNMDNVRPQAGGDELDIQIVGDLGTISIMAAEPRKKDIFGQQINCVCVMGKMTVATIARDGQVEWTGKWAQSPIVWIRFHCVGVPIVEEKATMKTIRGQYPIAGIELEVDVVNQVVPDMDAEAVAAAIKNMVIVPQGATRDEVIDAQMNRIGALVDDAMKDTVPRSMLRLPIQSRQSADYMRTLVPQEEEKGLWPQAIRILREKVGAKRFDRMIDVLYNKNLEDDISCFNTIQQVVGEGHVMVKIVLRPEVRSRAGGTIKIGGGVLVIEGEQVAAVEGIEAMTKKELDCEIYESLRWKLQNWLEKGGVVDPETHQIMYV